MKRYWLTVLAIGLVSACGGDPVASGMGSEGLNDATVAMSDAGSNEASGDGDASRVEDVGVDARTSDDMGEASEYDPRLPGRFDVNVVESMTTLGGEDVPLTVYSPTGLGPHPIVVFHHGFQLSPSLYSSYGQRLASWGYIAVFPEMPGGLIGGPTHRDLKEAMMELIDWVDEQIGDGSLKGNGDAIGLAGHSLGGKIALLTATEDARVSAVFVIDPVDSAPPGAFDATSYPSVTPELMPSISAPIGVVGETVNAACDGPFCQPCAPAEENFEQYFENAESPAYLLDVLEANHVSFLDDPDCGFSCSACEDGSDDPEVTRALTRSAMVAFFELKLRGESMARPFLTGAEAEESTRGLATYETKNGF